MNLLQRMIQEIQFLEFMGRSNLHVPQAFPNYLNCLHFIGIPVHVNMVAHFSRWHIMPMPQFLSPSCLSHFPSLHPFLLTPNLSPPSISSLSPSICTPSTSVFSSSILSTIGSFPPSPPPPPSGSTSLSLSVLPASPSCSTMWGSSSGDVIRPFSFRFNMEFAITWALFRYEEYTQTPSVTITLNSSNAQCTW